MLPQVIADRLPQPSGPEAMDDADRLLAFEQSPIKELIRFVERIVDVLPDEI